MHRRDVHDENSFDCSGSRSIPLVGAMKDTGGAKRKEIGVALLHEDRLFPAEEKTRAIARRLYDGIKDLPIVSPHGHTQAGWFARNEPFPDPVTLFVQPDHYVFRMLYSQGIAMEDLGIGQKELSADEARTSLIALEEKLAQELKKASMKSKRFEIESHLRKKDYASVLLSLKEKSELLGVRKKALEKPEKSPGIIAEKPAADSLPKKPKISDLGEDESFFDVSEDW